jgi:membrane protein implicated in regulation of membrane protease activity
MEYYIYWFSLAVVLLMMEMASGTFYMLILSLAFGVGGIGALAGLSMPLQIMLSALIGIIGIFLLRRVKTTTGTAQGLDIGQTVTVMSWREDGSARVRYRGTEWDAELESTDTPREGKLYIKEMLGSRLVLTHKI